MNWHRRTRAINLMNRQKRPASGGQDRQTVSTAAALEGTLGTASLEARNIGINRYLTVLTVLTIVWVGFARDVLSLMMRVPPRPSRPKIISIPAPGGTSAHGGAGQPALEEILATLHLFETRHLLKDRYRRARGLKHSRSTGSARP